MIIYIAIAFGLLFFNEIVVTNKYSELYTTLFTIGITLIVTIVISFIDNTCFDNEIEIATQQNIKTAEENFSVLKDCHDYGLIGIYEKFPITTEEVKNDFINSQSVHIAMNDGKNFFNDNRSLFLERVAIDTLSTTFIVQNYGKSDIMGVLARKNNHKDDYYASKIKNFITDQIENDLIIKKSRDHEIEVYLNSNYNTLAIIVTDNFAMYSIYRVSSGKTTVPHYVFKKDSNEYKSIKDDIENILKDNNKIKISGIVNSDSEVTA